MDIQKRRTFIISFIYFGIIGVLCYIGLKKLLPILIPFMAAMAIAAMLEPAVSLLDRHMKGGKGAAAAVVLLVFYGSILTIMCVSGSQILSSIQEQAKKLPGIYSKTIGCILLPTAKQTTATQSCGFNDTSKFQR